MSTIIRSVLLMQLCITLVSGGARLVLRMRQFSNSRGKDADGDCCDTPCLFSQKRCDHVFKICVSNANSDSSFDAASCPHYFRETGEYSNENTVDFGTRINGNIPNPITIDFDTWPGSIRLRLRAEDNDDSRPGGHDYVDSHNYLLTTTPDHHTESGTYRSQITSRGTRSRDKTLWKFQYQLYCLDNYYGPACSVYCVPRDDNRYGHYTCDHDTGAKVCRADWEDDPSEHRAGRYCNRYWNDCINHQCRHNGVCVDGTNSYTCRCTSAYTGPRCETDINECANRPCMHGATCNDLIGMYTCTCPPEYEGQRCQHHICDTGRVVCSNGGTCIEDGECDCPAAWTGPRCETDSCTVMDCGNYSAGCSHGQCECLPSHEGARCDQLVCDRIHCFHNATCVDGACVCPPGLSGEFCGVDIEECLSDPCINGGICEENIGGYVCSCSPGYTGANCEVEIDECQSTPCLYGNCTDGIGEYHCSCDMGYTGQVCDTHVCSEEGYCMNGGTCGPYGDCECVRGWVGARCELDVCEHIDCGDNATGCYRGECECRTGYEGTRCEQLICERITCHNDGMCVNGSCECKDGYTGRYCLQVVLTCQDCKNGAECVERGDGDVVCNCKHGYTGKFCESTIIKGVNAPVVGAATQTKDGGFHWWIIGLIGAVAVLIGVIVLLLFIMRRRGRNAKKQPPSAGGAAVVQAIGPFNNPLFTPNQQSNPVYDTAPVATDTASSAQPQPAPELPERNVVAGVGAQDTTSIQCTNPTYGQKERAIENPYSTIPELEADKCPEKRPLPQDDYDDHTENPYQTLDDCVTSDKPQDSKA